MSDRARRLAMLLLVVEVAGIAWLVLNPSSATPTEAVDRVSAFFLDHGSPAWMASTTGWEYVLNVALFVPLGLLCSLLWDRVSVITWTVVGCAISAAVELTQLAWLGDRSPSLTDVSANTLGMFCGAVLGALIRSFLVRRRRRG